MLETSVVSAQLAPAGSENFEARGLPGASLGATSTLVASLDGAASLSRWQSPLTASGQPGLGPILAASTPSWVAYYPFTGNSPASFDSDPLCVASEVSSTGFGPLSYSTSGNPAPALYLSSKYLPHFFSLDRYYSFTITPSPGYALNLYEFQFDVATVFQTGGGTLKYELRTSVDGFAAAVLSGTVRTASGVWGTVTTSLGSAFNNLESIEFRLYFADSNNAVNNYTLVDNITVVGCTVLVPEPKEAAFIGGLALLGFAVLRKLKNRAAVGSRVPANSAPCHA